MLDGRRILVTGVLTRDSIAFATARRAQELGAEVILTGFGRTRRMTERAAGQLPETVDVLELDVNSTEDVRALHGELTRALGQDRRPAARDRLRPARRARRRASCRRPMRAPRLAFQTSAYSLKALVAGLLDLLEAAPDGAGSGRAGLRRDRRLAGL